MQIRVPTECQRLGLVVRVVEANAASKRLMDELELATRLESKWVLHIRCVNRFDVQLAG